MALYVTTLGEGNPLQHYSVLLAVFVVLFNIVNYVASDDRPYAGFRLFGKENGEWGYAEARQRWAGNAKKIMRRGLQECQNKIFQVMGTSGPLLIVPPKYADEIRNIPQLTFGAFNTRDLFPSYPGFEPFRLLTEENKIFHAVIRKNLNQSLGGMTEDIAREATALLEEVLPVAKEWTGIKFYTIAPHITVRLGARVFLGEPICRDKRWLSISVDYTLDAFKAARKLRAYPPLIRPLIYRLVPEMRTVKKHLQDARNIIEPEVIARCRARQKAEEAGSHVKPADAVGWMQDQSAEANEPFDIVLGQMLLTVAAIHTTSNTITALIYDLAGDRQLMKDLREEIVQVLREDGGWKKTSLYKMKLLDSCMKESQRLNPIGSSLMNRLALQPVTLSDGTRIPKGAYLTVPTLDMSERERWGTNADKFDGRRFLNLRKQPGQENKWQFVTTSAEHFGFGHGQHACPGRFFASNQLKIAIAHLLLKYDFKLEGPPHKSLMESEYFADPNYTMYYRSRQPEVEL